MKVTYKLVSAVLALAVIAVLVFSPLVLVRIQSSAVQLFGTITQALGNEYANELVDETGSFPDHIGISISVAGLFDEDAQGTAALIKEFSSGDTEKTLKVLEPVISPTLTFVFALAVLAIVALATAITALVAKDNRKVIYLSIAGLFLSLIVPSSFTAVSLPFTSGEITLADIGGSGWITLLGNIDAMQLSSGFWFVTVLFAAIILWTVLYNYTLPADEKKKRLIMIGEAEEQ